MNRRLLDSKRIEHLRELSQDAGRDILAEVNEVYRKQGSSCVAEMRQALTRRDWDTLRQNAHTMEGSLVVFGAGGLLELCAELQTRAIAGDAEGCRKYLAAVEQENQRLLQALSRLAGSSGTVSSE